MNVTVGPPMPGDAGYLRGIDAQYQWQIALMRAMAEYWKDPNGQFAKILLSGNHAKIATLFRDVLGYSIPGGMKLKFETVDVSYNDKINVNGWADSLNQLTPEVTIQLPKPPKKTYQAKAISDYVATGKAYPFT